LQHDMIYCTDTYGAEVLRTGEDDRHFTVSPLFHAYGLGNGVFFPFRVGASTVYKPERATPDLVYQLITAERPTILFTAPTFYAALLAYPEDAFAYDLSSLRFCVSAGGALPDGYFVYEGRSDDMLKVSGQWVSPAEVEAALIEHPAVLECGVVGAKDKDDLVKPRAFVLLKNDRTPSAELAEELKAFVKGRITP